MTDKYAVKSGELGRMLGNVALFASKDASRPILMEIEFTAAEDRLTCVATDSYALGREWIGLNDAVSETRVWRITAAEAVQVAKACATHKAARASMEPLVVIEVTDDDAVFTVGAQTLTFRLATGEFPNWHGLWPETVNAVETFKLMSFHLVRFGKVKADRKPALKLTFNGSDKPAVFSVGEFFDGIVLPVRV